VGAVSGPEQGVPEAAYDAAETALKQFTEEVCTDTYAAARESVNAALPAIREELEAEREDERCESCDDTGIYEEGDEWAPCEECELGRDLKPRFLTTRREAQEELRRELLSEKTIQAAAEGLVGVGKVYPGDRLVTRNALAAALDSLTSDGEGG
jgi:hypothetical protein